MRLPDQHGEAEKRTFLSHHDSRIVLLAIADMGFGVAHRSPNRHSRRGSAPDEEVESQPLRRARVEVRFGCATAPDAVV